jgi:hypothetical protein
MKLAYLALAAAAATTVVGLAACSRTNPSDAANLQACKDFAAYKAAESADSFPAVAAHAMSVFITKGPGDKNSNVGEPLRDDLARIVAVAYNGNLGTIDTDIAKATADCAVVKATNGAKN